MYDYIKFMRETDTDTPRHRSYEQIQQQQPVVALVRSLSHQTSWLPLLKELLAHLILISSFFLAHSPYPHPIPKPTLLALSNQEYLVLVMYNSSNTLTKNVDSFWRCKTHPINACKQALCGINHMELPKTFMIYKGNKCGQVQLPLP